MSGAEEGRQSHQVPQEAYSSGTQRASEATRQAADGNEGSYKDREPPPSYDGESPETMFKSFQKQVGLWQFEMDVPRHKQGVKLLRALKGAAKQAVDDMEYEEVACEDGLRNVLNKLQDFFMPHLEVSLPRAFEDAVYGQSRGAKESFAEYLGPWAAWKDPSKDSQVRASTSQRAPRATSSTGKPLSRKPKTSAFLFGAMASMTSPAWSSAFASSTRSSRRRARAIMGGVGRG